MVCIEINGQKVEAADMKSAVKLAKKAEKEAARIEKEKDARLDVYHRDACKNAYRIMSMPDQFYLIANPAPVDHESYSGRPTYELWADHGKFRYTFQADYYWMVGMIRSVMYVDCGFIMRDKATGELSIVVLSGKGTELGYADIPHWQAEILLPRFRPEREETAAA